MGARPKLLILLMMGLQFLNNFLFLLDWEQTSLQICQQDALKLNFQGWDPMPSMALQITKNMNSIQQKVREEQVNKNKHILPMFWYKMLASCLIVELLLKVAACATSGFETIWRIDNEKICDQKVSIRRVV